MVVRIEAERLGEPITSIVCLGGPGGLVSGVLRRSSIRGRDVPENGFVRRISNSLDGGGATARGIVAVLNGLNLKGLFIRCLL